MTSFILAVVGGIVLGMVFILMTENKDLGVVVTMLSTIILLTNQKQNYENTR